MIKRQVELSFFFSCFVLVAAIFCLALQAHAYRDTEWQVEMTAIVRLTNMAVALCWVQVIERLLAGSGLPTQGGTLLGWRHFVFLMALLFLPTLLLLAPGLQPFSFVFDVVFAAIAVTGVVSALRLLSARQIAIAVVLSSLAALSFLLAILAKGYVSPISQQASMLHEIHKDSLFHAALINMIRDFDKVSLGLDGLVEMKYHVLNHQLSASISLWLGLPALSALHLTFLIVLFPAFMHALTGAALNLRRFSWEPFRLATGIALFLCWPLAFILFANTSYLASETYMLSLVVYLAALPLIFELLRSNRLDGQLAMLCLALALAIWIASQSKISTGLNLAGGVGFACLVAGRTTITQIPARLLAASVLAAAPFLAVFLDHVGVSTGAGAFGPFDVLFSYTRQSVMYALTVLATGAVLFNHLKADRAEWRALVTLFVMAAGAIFASMLLALPAGAALYFAAPSQWVCFVILAVVLKPSLALVGMSSRRLVAVSALLIIALTAFDPSRWRSIDRQADLADQLQANSGNAWPNRIIRDVAEARKTVGTDFLVHISPDFTSYWKAHPVCWANAFWIPAITAQPALLGVPGPASGCEPIKDYGFGSYPSSSRQTQADDDTLCQHAGKLGFSRIMEVHTETTRLLPCNSQ